MTFLAPALLALGLAAGVPLALHLMQRHQGRRVVFPALRYLRRAEREQATRLRLRQVLLLALRVLALLLLAAAAARPFLPVGGPGHHPTSVVVILDNSMASGAVIGERRVLDHLMGAARLTLARATADDRVWLIRGAQPWEPAVAGDLEVVADALRRTEPAATAMDVTSQLERAVSILSTEPAERVREIHLLSSLRGIALGRGLTATGLPPVLVLEPPSGIGHNRAITTIEVGGGLAPRSGERSTLGVTVRSFGSPPDDEPDSVDIRVSLDGVVRGVTRAPVDAVATLPFPAGEPGIVVGRVDIDPDAVAADDRRHFVTDVRPPPSVELSRALPFLDEAISVLEDAGRLRRASAGAGSVIIAPGASGAEAVRRGAALVVLPPESPVELAAANQRLTRAGIPWRFGPPATGEARLDPGTTGMDRLLEDVRVRQVYGLEPVGGPADTVLLRLHTGEPWAVAGDAGPGRYLLLATPLVPEAGNIPTSAAMLPLIDRAVTEWAPGTVGSADHRPGDVVSLPAADSIVRPDGSTDPVQAGAAYRLVLPGVYRVLAADSLVAAFAVNPPAHASDVRSVATAGIAELVPDGAVRSASATSWADAIFHRRLGRDVSLPLLVAALLVLLVESALAAAGQGRRRESVTAAGPGAGDPAGQAG